MTTRRFKRFRRAANLSFFKRHECHCDCVADCVARQFAFIDAKLEQATQYAERLYKRSANDPGVKDAVEEARRVLEERNKLIQKVIKSKFSM